LYDANSSHGSITITPDSLGGLHSDYNAVMDAFADDGSDTKISLAQWRQQTGQDAHSFVATPSQLFLNPSANDYHLKSGSPAVDTGSGSLAGLSAPTTDLDGISRPQGSNWDVGAYELVQTTTPI